MNERVLLIDAHEQGPVAACRSLAAAGYEVSAAGGAWPAPACWSRSCSQAFSIPQAETQPEAFIAGLIEILTAKEHSLLVIGGDASLRTVSEHRARLEPYARIGLPPHSVVERSLDKLELVEVASKLGISTPETFPCRGEEETAETARGLGFPVMIKPDHAGVHLPRRLDRRSRVAWDEESLIELLHRLGGQCLVQRRLVGAVCSCGGVMTEEGLLALAFSRYQRTWPPDGGNCAFSASVAPPPGLPNTLELLLHEFGWSGIFELELMLDEQGTWYPLDFNPRLYGSLALAIRAGVPLPVLWCDRLLGRRNNSRTPRVGVHYRCEDADARNAVWQVRHGDAWGAARILRPKRNVAHAYGSWRDPAPLLARFIHLAALAATRVSRTLRLYPARQKREAV